MSSVRTSDKLHNVKVKGAGSAHDLGEAGEGLRLVAASAGGPAEPVQGGSIPCQPPQGSTVVLSDAEPGGRPKLEGYSIPGHHALRSARQGNHVSRPQPATLA